MSRVVHFEIGADNMERAREFYSKAFGWQMMKWDGGGPEYWLIQTGAHDQPGIDGGLAKREGQIVNVNTIDVAEIDEAIHLVEKHGGKIVRPKMTIPGVGHLAYFEDPEGNVFGMMQSTQPAQ